MILNIPNMVTMLFISEDKVKDDRQSRPEENIRQERNGTDHKSTRAEIKQNYITENEAGSCCTAISVL